MDLREPAQPFAFLEWLRARVVVRGLRARAPVPESDGTMTFSLVPADGARRVVRVRWSPVADRGARATAVRADGPLVGAVWSDEAPPAVVREVAASLSALVARDDPVFLRAGPGPDDPVPFTPEGLGDLLRRQVRPGETRWGPFLAVAFDQPDPHRLVFRFEGDGGSPSVVIALVAPPSKARFHRGDLSFVVVEDTRTPQQRRRADHQVERLIGFAVGRALARDPPLVVPETPAAVAAAPGCTEFAATVADGVDPLHARARHEAFIRRWNAEWRWRRFLYPASRCIVNLFRLGPEDALVVHESLECVQNEPPWLPAGSAFWHTRRGTRVGEFWQRAHLEVTDLREADVVRGRSMDALEAALEATATRPGGRSVVVVSGCLPNVIGDNPVPAMRRLSRTSPCRFYWVGNTNDFQGYTAALIRDRLTEVAPASAPRDPLGFAIVGGGSARENRDLLDLAARAGLHPMGVVLPEVGYDVFSRVAGARVFAWANQSALRDVSELAFSELPVVLLRPPSPVGIRGTFEWLREVVAQAAPGMVERVATMENDESLRSRLERLRARTGRHRLVFVADREDLGLFVDTRPMYAYSLLDVLVEMGFGLRIVVHGDLGSYQGFVREFGARGWAGRVDLVPFGSPRELTEALREPGGGAVFSNITADPRVTAAGRNVFSEADVEMGIEGFFRTAERLAERCEVRPLAGYERWLPGGGWAGPTDRGGGA